MYFSSQGHNSMGGFDIFSSKLGPDGEWSKPENLGYPLNTVDDDIFFQPMADGRRAYYASEKDGGYGKTDIYLVDLPKEISESAVAVLKGFIIGEDGKELPADLKVIVTNLKNNEKSEYRPRMRDGGFLAVLSPCTNYEIEYFIGLDRIKQDAISIPCENVFMEIEREVFIIDTKATSKEEPKVEEPVKKDEPAVTDNKDQGNVKKDKPKKDQTAAEKAAEEKIAAEKKLIEKMEAEKQAAEKLAADKVAKEKADKEAA
jgi:hypothetical protein